MSNKINTAENFMKNIRKRIRKRHLTKKIRTLMRKRNFNAKSATKDLSVLQASVVIALSSNINHHVSCITIITLLEYNTLDLVIRNIFTTHFRSIGN